MFIPLGALRIAEQSKLHMPVQTGKAEVYSASYSWSRVYFYNFLVFLRGIGEITVGSIVVANLSNGR